ncbi:restriction endonuclease subunit S [Methylomonas sp. AM2-LC]|uniref:restriction endonuclease subunit S n=1 Tax=Methylomonas sp. AM2-LC TaxID=3153301 RepID=UPI0032630F9D
MLPSGWEKQAIGKLCQSIVPGRNKPKSFDGHIPWITTPEIQGRYIPSEVQKNYVSLDAIKESGAKIVPVGSVIISAVGELGLTAIAKEEIVLNQQLHAFVCPDYICNEYLAYWLSTQKAYMDSVASKTTIPYMNKANCESIPVAYPPLPEQQKIAQILSTWDKAIQKLEALIASKQKRKKALMQQLLTGNKRFAGFEGEWRPTFLGKVADIVMGSSPKSEAYNEIGEGLPLLQGNTDIKNRLSAPRIYTTEITKECSPGDILLSVRAPVGAIALSLHTACIGRGIAGLKAKHGFCQGFLYQWLIFFEPKWDRLSQGSTFESVNSADIKNLHVFLPVDIKEQHKIASVFTTADTEIQTHQKQLFALKEQKKGLMQQLLTGKIRVKLDKES